MQGINAIFRPDPSVADAMAEIPEQVEEIMRVWKANVAEQEQMKG